MSDTVQVAAIGAITRQDVLTALGDTDPNSTNAGKLQKIIGRGSTSTVQRYLDEIRASLVVPPVAPGAAPTPPADVVAAIWASAWSAAQVHTLGRLETVTAQRDALLVKAETQASDIAALTIEMDQVQASEAAAIAKEIAATQAIESSVTAYKVKLDKATEDYDANIDCLMTEKKDLIQEVARVKAEASNAAAIATRDAQITAAAMQVTIDRLTDQVAELKSIIHQPKTSN